MKKITIILLLCAYSFSTIGATIEHHFCMNEYVSSSFGHSKNQTCGKCGMKENNKKKGCCKNETQVLKVNDEHQKSYISALNNPFFTPALLLTLFDYKSNNYFSNKRNVKYYHPPPNILSLQLYKLYGVFLI